MYMRYNGTMKNDITKENKVNFAYARVSTRDQSLDRQIDMLEKYDIPSEHFFTDKMSGTKKSRPGFDALLDRLEPGDRLYVESFSRLSRSTKDLLDTIEALQKRGVSVISLKESFDTTTPVGKVMLTFIAALSQFERDLLSQRTKEGLESARARGRRGGRKPFNTEKMEQAMILYNSGVTVNKICDTCGIKRSTFYKYKKIEEEKNENIRDVG